MQDRGYDPSRIRTFCGEVITVSNLFPTIFGSLTGHASPSRESEPWPEGDVESEHPGGDPDLALVTGATLEGPPRFSGGSQSKLPRVSAPPPEEDDTVKPHICPADGLMRNKQNRKESCVSFLFKGSIHKGSYFIKIAKGTKYSIDGQFTISFGPLFSFNSGKELPHPRWVWFATAVRLHTGGEYRLSVSLGLEIWGLAAQSALDNFPRMWKHLTYPQHLCIRLWGLCCRWPPWTSGRRWARINASFCSALGFRSPWGPCPHCAPWFSRRGFY